MHLLIDVRTSCPSDIPNLYYAELWSDIWISYHPHDRITFLAYTGDPVDEEYECIFLKRGGFLGKKKIASHEYGPHRVISFSRLPSIDTSIPTLLHISDFTRELSPKESQNIFLRKYEEYQFRKLLGSVRQIIVPHIDIGRELTELYGIDESHMSVIPYYTPTDISAHRGQTILPHGISGEYYITEGTPGEEWQPLGLIRAFAQLSSEQSNAANLVIIGDIGTNMSNITTLIRSLGMTTRIKLVGILSRREREILYSHAIGWIYAGYSYSRSASASMASGYGLPLFLSDISGLRDYTATFFHPNHIDSLAIILSVGSSQKKKSKNPNNESIMQVYTRIIAE